MFDICTFTAVLLSFAVGRCVSKTITFVALCDIELGSVSFSLVESAIYYDAFLDAVVGLMGVVCEDDDRMVLCGFIGSPSKWYDLHDVKVTSLVLFLERLDLSVVGVMVVWLDVAFIDMMYYNPIFCYSGFDTFSDSFPIHGFFKRCCAFFIMALDPDCVVR